MGKILIISGLILILMIGGCVTQDTCAKDEKICPDGTKVTRDASNNCEFFTCPGGDCTAACTEELKACPGGYSVGRDPCNNCEFEPCPDLEIGHPKFCDFDDDCEIVYNTMYLEKCSSGCFNTEVESSGSCKGLPWDEFPDGSFCTCEGHSCEITLGEEIQDNPDLKYCEVNENCEFVQDVMYNDKCESGCFKTGTEATNSCKSFAYDPDTEDCYCGQNNRCEIIKT